MVTILLVDNGSTPWHKQFQCRVSKNIQLDSVLTDKFCASAQFHV